MLIVGRVYLVEKKCDPEGDNILEFSTDFQLDLSIHLLVIVHCFR